MDKKKDITEEKTTKQLTCKLPNDEYMEKARKLANLEQDKEALELEKKESNADFNARTKKIEADIGVLTRVVSSGEEHREVDCLWKFNWPVGEKVLVRLDTGEVVRTESIRESERQQRLTFKKREMEEAAKAPYGIWDGEKFLVDDNNERFETSTIGAGIDIKKKLEVDGAANLKVISIAEAPLKESLGDQAGEEKEDKKK